MEVHTAINCDNKDCFVGRLEKASSFLDDGNWVHIDVSDGIFTKAKSFYDTDEILKYKKRFRFESHLMIDRDSLYSDEWFGGVFDRILIHASYISDWDRIREMSDGSGTEIGVVILYDENPSIVPEWASIVEVLAVKPGFSGQDFNDEALDLIKFFKNKRPNVKIMVDGGVNYETAMKIKTAGADILVSSSYIFNSENPAGNYNRLANL